MPKFFNHALQLEDVRDVVIDGFDARQPHPEGEAVALNRVAGVSIRGCKAAEGTDTFVSGVNITDGRLFTNNDLREARTFYLPSDVGFLMSDNLLPSRSRQDR